MRSSLSGLWLDRLSVLELVELLMSVCPMMLVGSISKSSWRIIFVSACQGAENCSTLRHRSSSTLWPSPVWSFFLSSQGHLPPSSADKHPAIDL